MSNIDFVKLCESVLEEKNNEELLMLIEAETQKKSQFQINVEKIAQKLNTILNEVKIAKKNRGPNRRIEDRKDDILVLRNQLIQLLNEGRKHSIAQLASEHPFSPYTGQQADNFIYSKVEEGGVFEFFGKLLRNFFGEEQFPELRAEQELRDKQELSKNEK